MSFSRFCIIVLYGLSGLLPLIGFSVSYVKHRCRIRREQDRQRHIESIDRELEERREAATTPEEVLEADRWHDEENAKEDPSGKPYRIRGGVLLADDSVPRVKEQYNQLRSDMFYVGVAVVCGAGASIWSMLLPPTG